MFFRLCWFYTALCGWIQYILHCRYFYQSAAVKGWKDTTRQV